ncbi:SGNH hydrolase-type esterase domain-containing protein [Cercophora scortea]|uniref:SGNH hydrolase-type esterase domain-containing protein n=1 Tax=Cercophora scortea TaxID=314031 RepID=A0AAE0IYW8_9PEZI|nr:SGNH hydrolase-type esterase domain-containing protein [Cercophora scortea]
MLPLTLLPLLLLSQTASTAPNPQSQHILTAPSSPPHRKPGSSFVSFGDSYSAGIGTPLPPNSTTESACRRGAGAYPVLLSQDLSPNDTTFQWQWLSCTGATTLDLLSHNPTSPSTSQIDAFTPTPQTTFATLSIGGNDLGFFAVINACIFRFYGPSSGTCAAALAASDALLSDTQFELRLSIILIEILDKVRWERAEEFSVAVTGYARFFDEGTEECDGVSFSVWAGDYGSGGNGTRLTREVRGRLNGLVDGVNGKLRRGVEEANRRFGGEGKGGGRGWCLWTSMRSLTGIDSVKRGCKNRIMKGRRRGFFCRGRGMLIYLLMMMVVIASDSKLVDPEKCLRSAEASGDWGELAVCYMAIARRNHPELVPSHRRVLAQGSMWYVPTYYGKTFHPRSLGHRAVRDRIYKVWEENGL